MNDDRTPIIVGTGQLVDRQASIENHIEPLQMLIRTASSALDDAGIGQSDLQTLDTMAMVGVAGWHPQNAPAFVAEKLGVNPANCYTTGVGGQVGVTITNLVAEKIIQGESQFAIIGGCNNLKVLMKAIAQKTKLDWARGGEGSATMVGGDEPGNTELERKYGLISPPDIYPLFENALRARLGLGLEQHQQRMGNLFSRFTDVAEANPYAWFPVKRSAEELTTVTQANRMIAWPYPKYLNAILNTEQAASLVMMSVGKAKKLGIPESKWVYWTGGASSQEQAWWASERPDFSRCPAMKESSTSALFNAGLDIADVQHFDFYSCFPVAVQMACDMLGLDVADERGFTVCGGLPYAGGPASAYTLHSMASMVAQLQGKTSSKGLVTGNGWYLTKHAATVLSTDPHANGNPVNGLMADLPSNGMAKDACTVDEQVEGDATIETYTVRYGRDGKPEQGIVLGKTDSGVRFMSNTIDDESFLTEFVQSEQVGTRGRVDFKSGRSVFTPG